MPYLEGHKEETLKPENADKELFFGPLSAPLGKLYDMGWVLQTYPMSIPQGIKPEAVTVKVYLAWGPERYLVAKTKADYIIDKKPLSDLNLPWTNLLSVCSTVPRDPWEQLTERHARPKKKVHMIGNMTLREYTANKLGV